MNDPMLVALGAVLGGVGAKLLDLGFGLVRSRSTDAAQIRSELRADKAELRLELADVRAALRDCEQGSAQLKERVRQLEEEVGRWAPGAALGQRSTG